MGKRLNFYITFIQIGIANVIAFVVFFSQFKSLRSLVAVLEVVA